MRALRAVLVGALASCADHGPPVSVCSDAGSIIYRADVLYLSNDPLNCGCVGEVCPAPQGEHALPSCAAGVCGRTCAAGWGDCDGDLSNGCEASLRERTDHCGTCGVACRPARATPACVEGRCTVGTCDPGTADCDGVVENGCETSIESDASHCGGCRARCALPRATATCVVGRCNVARCESGWRDCDRDPANGCEVSSSTDVLHCGGCGALCSAANATPRCEGGACRYTCLPGYLDCDLRPENGCEVDSQVDLNHCGACGAPCARSNALMTCVAGHCELNGCESGYGDCDRSPSNGCEVNLSTDANHCNSCGLSCAVNTGTAYCSARTCMISGCNPGRGNCDRVASNGCEVDTTSSSANCGGCSTPGNSFTCGFNRHCVGSRCVCTSGLSECSGQCVSLQTNNSHCGRCGNVCPGERQCINGSCQCPSGYTACRDFCRSCPAGSTLQCGATGFACCPTGRVYCDPAQVCWSTPVACNTLTRCPSAPYGWAVCSDSRARLQCGPPVTCTL